MIGKLSGGGRAQVEIERKFLLRAPPDRKPDRIYKIRQGYLAREAGNAVRIRQKDKRYILSVKTPAPGRQGGKGQAGLARHEVEVEIDAAAGRTLFAACPRPWIEKRREIYVLGDHLWEVDVFGGANKGLIIAEVELKSATEQVSPPAWIGPEVTGLQKFYNAHLAQNPFRNWGVTYAELVQRMQG